MVFWAIKRKNEINFDLVGFTRNRKFRNYSPLSIDEMKQILHKYCLLITFGIF